jgi:hypothetical protein
VRRFNTQQNETLNVVEVVEPSIFSMKRVVFESESPEIISKIDRTQLIQSSLIWLKCHSIDSGATRKENRICNGKKDSNNVLIIVEDNGIGIRRYQPYFRT